MVAMWHRMGAFFGSAWESQYGTTENQTIHAWQGALASLTVGELAHGIRRCEKWDGKFPPTFPEFRALCVSERNRQRNLTEERIERERRTGQSDTALEHLARSATSEVAKRELDRMKRLHAGEHVESIEKSRHNLGLHRRWPGAWPD